MVELDPGSGLRSPDRDDSGRVYSKGLFNTGAVLDFLGFVSRNVVQDTVSIKNPMITTRFIHVNLVWKNNLVSLTWLPTKPIFAPPISTRDIDNLMT